MATPAGTNYEPDNAGVRAWIERSVAPAARVTRFEAMPPSATTKHRVEVRLADGASVWLVLRRYHDAKRLASDPWYVPAHEARALAILAGTRVPAPTLYAADLGPAICDVPALLETWLPGAPAWRPIELDAYLDAAARVLVDLHALAPPSNGTLPRYAPYRGQERLVSPPFSTRPGLWEQADRVLAAPWPRHRETFIHRDYHPGNVLWDRPCVSGVVDWATAACGPPGIDLARMRVNLAALHGLEVADRFTLAYARAGGDASARHPYWDLLDAADLVPDQTSDWAHGGSLARFEEYAASVLAECERIGRQQP